MTPSDWLSRNMADVIVALAQAGATLVGSAAERNVPQADTRPQEAARDEQ